MSDMEYLLKKNPNAYVSEVTDEVLEVLHALEHQLALARELLKECLYWLGEDGIDPKFWTPEYKAFHSRLAKLSETKS